VTPNHLRLFAILPKAFGIIRAKGFFLFQHNRFAFGDHGMRACGDEHLQKARL
jgi:hypothetical protein